MIHTKIQAFLPAIKRLPINKTLTKADLLTKPFLMEQSKDLSMYYAPHNDYINEAAKIVIVGITPGWHQMRTAFEQLLRGMALQQDMEQLLKETKTAASFAGTMRSNLVEMLDQCHIPDVVHISSASLFRENRHLIHTTSLVKYPVFYKGKNYTGHNPDINQSSLLTNYAYQGFPEEMANIQQHALVIPLGKMTEQVIRRQLAEERLPDHTYLLGFPHPSGANGHRKKQFLEEKEQLISTIHSWSGKI